MKVTFEKLDRGYLITAEEAGRTERVAYMTAEEAFGAVAEALGIGETGKASRPIQRRSEPVAPLLDEDRSEDDEPENQPPPPPTTRRIGLSQAKKSLPPVSRRSSD